MSLTNDDLRAMLDGARVPRPFDTGVMSLDRIAAMATELLATRKALAAQQKRVLDIVRGLREGNMMLDNEPVLFVRGYEAAVEELAAALAPPVKETPDAE
jgi:hypothetical protein